MIVLTEKIGVRLRPDDLQLVKRVCEARGESHSTFFRRAIRRELARLNFLTPEEKKALQVPTAEEVKTG